MSDLEEKIYNGEILAENELSIIPWCTNVIETIQGNDHRWAKEMKTIFKIKDKMFALDWMKGFTECQEHEFYSQPYEVVKKTRIIEETYYEAK